MKNVTGNVLPNVGPSLQGLLGAGSSSPRTQLTALLNDGNTVANYQAGVGQTDAGSGKCSAWANQIGAAGSLASAVDANRPIIQGDGSLLFDGSNDELQVALTLAQPFIVYLVYKSVTWSSNKIILGFDSGCFYRQSQSLASPYVESYAGGAANCSNDNHVIDSYGVDTVLFNGASSSVQVDSTSPVVADIGTDGIATTMLVGRYGGGGLNSNIQVEEIVLRSVADNSTVQGQIQSLLKQIYGTP